MPNSFHAPTTRDFSWLCLPPEKHPSFRFIPFTRRSSSQARGGQWEHLEQAAPLLTEFPPPKALPKPQPAGSAVVSAELPPLAELSCSPAQALQPSSASLCWSQADVLTCEQLLLKNRYPPFQRAKSLGQPGKAGRGHRLDLFLLCAPCGVSHEGASGWRWSLGTRAGAFACWKPFPLESLTSTVCFGICDPHRAIFLHFPILSLLPYSVCRWDQPLSCLSSKEGIMLCHHLSYCSFLQQISIMIGREKKKLWQPSPLLLAELWLVIELLLII